MTDGPTPPKSKLSWSSASKNLVFWMLIVMLSLAFYRMTVRGRDDHTEIDYTLFRAQLDASNIASVEITDGKFIEGEFNSPVVVERRAVQAFSVVLPIQDSEDLLLQLEQQQVKITGKVQRPSFGTIFLNFLPWIILIGLWIFFFRQVQQGGNRAFQFGRSKAKMLTGDTPKVSFSDVAGADEAKVELEEIIEFLKDPQKFQRLGGRLPKGVLLVGPPGTGKTLLARAVAGEAARPFFSMSGSDFVEMFVGVGASRVRDLFEQGKAHAPCLIFIDEIDAVGRHRGAGLGGGHDEREQTLNQLLVEMDGFASNEGVILLAATNRPDVLDPALLRPGRFDRQIVVDLPDIRGREQILKVHARKIPLSDDVNLGVIAKSTPGLAGADLANLVNEGALLAARRAKQRVDMIDLEDAKDKVMLGVERRSMVLTDEERKLTAYHEAGHAIVNLSTPGQDPVHKVTIIPRGQSLGLTFALPEQDRRNYTREYMHGKLAMAFGGRVAEELIFGRPKVTTGAAQDIEQATTMARSMITRFGMSDEVGLVAVGEREQQIFIGRDIGHRHEVSAKLAELVDSEIKKFLDEAHGNALRILTEKMDVLHAMANALLERETLNREDVELLVAGKELPPPPAEDTTDDEPLPLPSGERKPSGVGPVLGTPPPKPAGA
ncbi:MAG: ATP-dependent zinc metalloprotease FtsH [Gemmatimonadetes bacterium]|nr:ATP-dependent zinc metalloprotease FtsH [Gemmatimonadota bacterium]